MKQARRMTTKMNRMIRNWVPLSFMMEQQLLKYLELVFLKNCQYLMCTSFDGYYQNSLWLLYWLYLLLLTRRRTYWLWLKYAFVLMMFDKYHNWVTTATINIKLYLTKCTFWRSIWFKVLRFIYACIVCICKNVLQSEIMLEN